MSVCDSIRSLRPESSLQGSVVQSWQCGEGGLASQACSRPRPLAPWVLSEPVGWPLPCNVAHRTVLPALIKASTDQGLLLRIVLARIGGLLVEGLLLLLARP